MTESPRDEIASGGAAAPIPDSIAPRRRENRAAGFFDSAKGRRDNPAVLEFCSADGPEDLEAARRLFVEYAGELGIDLSFQGFDDELAGLPGRYAPPDGRLVLAREDGRAIRCVALRRIGQGVCEMKRLYVRPECRGTGVGRRLAGIAIDEARAAGYRLMKLDTPSSMAAANRLYESLGFVDTVPYGDHPIPGTRCMERPLA